MYHNVSLPILSLTVQLGWKGQKSRGSGNGIPNKGWRVPSRLCHLGKRRAVDAKWDFPRVKQCRGRCSAGGAESKPCCWPKKGERYLVVIYHRCL